MEFNNINQPSQQPSIFRFEFYPNDSTYSWCTNMQEPKLTQNANFQAPIMVPNFFQSIPTTQPPSTEPTSSIFQFGMCGLRQMPVQTTSLGYPDQRMRFHLGKRKCDSPPLQPCKQHITEEKMAEYMSKLHINSETSTSLEPELLKNKRLYMCEEMRKLQADSLLPASLLKEIRKPCTALVLWQPPPRLSVAGCSTFNNNNNNEDNEEESVRDKREIPSLASDLDMDNEFGGSMDLDS
ncbi:uncharacterized protein [Euwallacea fornicatus]|uniref:uncharacterized protein n=1 Tax=Euwallacea fornicatus TaxID=995702 RepID=UPI00338E7BD7